MRPNKHVAIRGLTIFKSVHNLQRSYPKQMVDTLLGVLYHSGVPAIHAPRSGVFHVICHSLRTMDDYTAKHGESTSLSILRRKYPFLKVVYPFQVTGSKRQTEPGSWFRLIHRGTSRPSAYNLWFCINKPEHPVVWRSGPAGYNDYHRTQRVGAKVGPTTARLFRALRTQISTLSCFQGRVQHLWRLLGLRSFQTGS